MHVASHLFFGLLLRHLLLLPGLSLLMVKLQQLLWKYWQQERRQQVQEQQQPHEIVSVTPTANWLNRV